MSEIGATEHFDVVIVGAGPAGLIAAAVLAAGSRHKVLVLEKGPEIGQRESNSQTGRSWVEGIGGAGLYSDGKLCMSLDVGGHLRDELPQTEKDRLLRILEKIFQRVLGQWPASFTPFGDNRETVRDSDVTVTTYPVLHIGTDRGSDVIREIVGAVRRLGVQVRSNTELVDVARNPNGSWAIKLAIEGGTHLVNADSLILAMGKVGAQLQAKLCEKNGASLISVPMDIGVRLECDASALSSLFTEARDPKIKLSFADGTRVKTHCATMRGEIATLRYEGLPLAGGHAYATRKTDRSGFAILWDGIRRANNYGYALDLMQRISQETGGRLMVQRLVDFLADRTSTPEEIETMHPTVDSWKVGNIRAFLPNPFAEKVTAFLRILEVGALDLKEANCVLVAPAIEWWMRRVEADPRSMRSSAGIYVCGDGSGWSQGIVHAAATGIIAAEDLLHEKTSPDDLAIAMFPTDRVGTPPLTHGR